MTPRIGRWLGVLLAMLSGPALAQEKTVITVSRQPSIIYMPTYIMEVRHGIEAHAAALGVANLKVDWVTFNGGGAATDALLAESVDMVDTGAGNMLLLWDRTRGRVKGIAATSAEPLILISRDPRLKTLADYGPGDKIALPTIKVSTQAVLLQIACVKAGKPFDCLDANAVQLGHPDAAAALNIPNGELSSHFSAPPFFQDELKRVHGAHIVTDSSQILGEPLSVAILFTTTKFAGDNPRITLAAKQAVLDAVELIHSDTREAVRIYKQASGDPMPEDDMLALLRLPGMMDFYARPQGTMVFAHQLFQTGLLKTEPKAWTDYFLPVSADLGGS